MLSLCGEDLSDETILANTPEYLPILDELKGRTVEEYKRIIKGKQTAINGELQAIPQRISEASLAIPENGSFNETDIAMHETKITEFKDKLNELHNNSGQKSIDAEIQSLLYKKKEIENVLPDTYKIEVKNEMRQAGCQTDKLKYLLCKEN